MRTKLNPRSHLPLFRRFLSQGAKPASPASSPEEVLAPLDPPYRAALLSMYRNEPQLGAGGQLHPIDPHTRVSPRQGMELYDLCVSLNAQSTLEIGMAYGFSTLYFLGALARNHAGRHTSIDPFQHSQWHAIGLTHARAVATGSAFRLIEDRSDRVAADLARQNARFDMIFIDGNHRFDDVLVDFYLYAPFCKVGGLIAFDDIWMHSIQTVLAFIRSNRPDFAEVSTSDPNLSVFRRIGEDARNWRHFRPFSVSPLNHFFLSSIRPRWRQLPGRLRKAPS